MKKVLKFYPPGYDSKKYWEGKYAKENLHRDSREFEGQRFWNVLEHNLQKGKRYLDVGCGIGGWMMFLRTKGYSVEGIDTAEETVALLRSHFPSLPVQVGSINAVPYPDTSFDGILAIGTLEYAEDAVPAALKEIHRVVRPGGIVFLEMPLLNTLRRFLYLPLKETQRVMMRSRCQVPTFSHYVFTRRTIKRELAKAGFRVLEVRPHELPGIDQHYGLYVDWFLFRGPHPYTLNRPGRIVRALCDAISPWIASTGIIVVAQRAD